MPQGEWRCETHSGLPRSNRSATRESSHTDTPFHQARAVPPGTFKTVFDAWNGYHFVPLRECDRHYTTFKTPWGRYRYIVAPQGYTASGDGYTARYDQLVSHIPKHTRCASYGQIRISPSCIVAGYLCPEWHHPQPCEIPLRSNQSGICRCRDHPHFS